MAMLNEQQTFRQLHFFMAWLPLVTFKSSRVNKEIVRAERPKLKPAACKPSSS